MISYLLSEAGGSVVCGGGCRDLDSLHVSVNAWRFRQCYSTYTYVYCNMWSTLPRRVRRCQSVMFFFPGGDDGVRYLCFVRRRKFHLVLVGWKFDEFVDMQDR